jgi:hypothetical protein
MWIFGVKLGGVTWYLQELPDVGSMTIERLDISTLLSSFLGKHGRASYFSFKYKNARIK